MSLFSIFSHREFSTSQFQVLTKKGVCEKSQNPVLLRALEQYITLDDYLISLAFKRYDSINYRSAHHFSFRLELQFNLPSFFLVIQVIPLKWTKATYIYFPLPSLQIFFLLISFCDSTPSTWSISCFSEGRGYPIFFLLDIYFRWTSGQPFFASLPAPCNIIMIILPESCFLPLLHIQEIREGRMQKSHKAAIVGVSPVAVL